MDKIKMILGIFWAFLRRVGFYFKLGYIKIVSLIKKTRRGEAMEIHPLVGKYASILFRLVFVLTILVFVAEIAFGVGIYKYKKSDSTTKAFARYIPFPAAVVQGRIVTMNDYFKNLAYIEQFYSKTQQSGVDLAAIRTKVIAQLIDNELLASQAKKYNVTVTDADVENAYSEVVTQNGGEAEVQKVLNDLYGLSIRDFKQLISDQLLEQKLTDAVPVQVHAQHILIRADQNADAATVAAAKAKIDKIYADVNAGADFSDQAKKLSEDTGSASNGGDLGFFARGQMDTDFENAAFSTPVVQVSAPFRSQFGWHIVKVLEKKGFVDLSFDNWLASLRKDSIIFQLLKV